MKHTFRATKLILIILSAVMLTSCFYKKASSPADETTDTLPQTTETQPQTTETQPQTTETVITTEIDLEKLEYSIEMPSEELQKRFVEEWKKQHPDSGEQPSIQRWYGSYGNIHFLLIDVGQYPHMNWEEDVAGYIFSYGDGRSISVWVNGRFYTLKKAYANGKITKEMVATMNNVREVSGGIAPIEMPKNNK